MPGCDAGGRQDQGKRPATHMPPTIKPFSLMGAVMACRSPRSGIDGLDIRFNLLFNHSIE